jgi:hypothetical protein
VPFLMPLSTENQPEIIKNICITFAKELRDYTLSSSLKKISEYRIRYSFFRLIAIARHRQTSLSLLSLNRDFATMNFEKLLLTLKTYIT